MGTRNLTIVIQKEENKVVQYGQWDGYPTGQGQTIADFLNTVDLDLFKQQVEKLGEYTDEDIKKIYELAGADDSGWVTMEVSDKVKKSHPELSRDQGADILNLIHDGTATRVNLYPLSYKDDSSCEYWYEINLDNETVTMNGTTYTFKQWKRKGFMEKLEASEDVEN